MFAKLFYEPKKFWGTLLVLFLGFLLLTAYGGRKVYENEKRELKQEAEAKLRTAEELIQASLADLAEEHRFLWQQAMLAEYLASGFADPARRAALKAFFLQTLETHHAYRQIALVKKDGEELVHVRRAGEKGRAEVAPAGQSQLYEYQSCLNAAECPGERQGALFSAVLLDDGAGGMEPGLRISAGLCEPAGNLQGILTLSLSLKKILALLPPGTSLQTGNDSKLDACLSGGIGIQPQLEGERGALQLSDTQVLHYLRTDFGSGRQAYITFSQDLFRLKTFLLRITLIFLAILSAFFLVILAFYLLRSSQFKEMIEAQRTIVFSLASLAEWRDTDTGRHLERTRNFSVVLARQLRKDGKYADQITERFLADLYDAAPLHDLGKVGIPDSILLKNGRLTPEEFGQMQQHVLMGREIIQGVIDKLSRPESFLLMSRSIAEFHHERYDGKGYPHGLAGEDIPLESRIYALCDAYDAIRSLRPYKEPVSHPEALERIKAGRGSHFDPDVVDAFFECETEFVEIFEAHLLYDEVSRHFSGERRSGELGLVWSEKLAVGLPLIDAQHRELINRINALYQHIFHGRGKEESVRLIRFLADYVVAHFKTEEDLMLKHGYPDYPAHKEMHDCFIEDFTALTNRIKESGISSELVVQINRQVVHWLVNHILMVDKGLSRMTEAHCAGDGRVADKGNRPTSASDPADAH